MSDRVFLGFIRDLSAVRLNHIPGAVKLSSLPLTGDAAELSDSTDGVASRLESKSSVVTLVGLRMHCRGWRHQSFTLL